jgi:hypothetical protein
MRPAFVVLPSQHGLHRIEPGEGERVCEACGCMLRDQSSACYVDAMSPLDLKVRVVDEGLPQCPTHACSTLPVTVATIATTREVARFLLGFSGFDMSLCKVT